MNFLITDTEDSLVLTVSSIEGKNDGGTLSGAACFPSLAGVIVLLE